MVTEIVCSSCHANFDNGHGRHAPWCGHPYEQLVKDAIAAERERCAKIATKVAGRCLCGPGIVNEINRPTDR